MDLSEMHVWFRQYAQQMGMQNVRALLPESIDLLINTSITDTINQIIVQNIGVTNDRIITDNSKIGQINALKTLYTVKSYKIFDYSYSKLTDATIDIPTDSQEKHDFFNCVWEVFYGNNEHIFITLGEGTDYNIDTTDLTDSQIIDAVNLFVSNNVSDSIVINFSLNQSDTTEKLVISGYSDSIVAFSSEEVPEGVTLTPTSYRFTLTDDNIYKGLLSCNSIDISYLYLVDFAIDYKVSKSGMTTDTIQLVDYVAGGFTTKLFPVRLIDDMYLADALNDFMLAPKLRSPILTVNSKSYDLYFDKFIKVSGGGYTLDNGLVPYNLRISYIAKPNKVEYRLDKGLDNIDCNLPEYLHVDILKHAVDLYRASISGSLFSQQAQDQQQQREIARNTATPSNGYQN